MIVHVLIMWWVGDECCLIYYSHLTLSYVIDALCYGTNLSLICY